VLEEVDDLAELLDRLVQAGDVAERRLHLLAVVDLHAVAAEVEGGAGLHPAHPPDQEEPQQPEQQQRRHPAQEEARQPVRLDPLDADALGLQVLRQLGGVVAGRHLAREGHVLTALPEGSRHGRVRDRDVAHDLPRVGLLQERGEDDRGRPRRGEVVHDDQHEEEPEDPHPRRRAQTARLAGRAAAEVEAVPPAAALVVVRHRPILAPGRTF
jgi:hypothetical protein